MKLQMIETKEGTGDWIYVRQIKDDGNSKHITVLGYGNALRTRDEAIERAREIMRFYLVNNGPDRILEEIEINHE